MSALVFRAHYDGKGVVLDEPCALPANTPLAVTVLPLASLDHDTERADWAALGAQNLARAYGDTEPEYTVADLKPQS
jgi:hypothetical protein